MMKAERQAAPLHKHSTDPFLQKGNYGSMQPVQHSFFQPKPYINLQPSEDERETGFGDGRIMRADIPGIQLKGGTVLTSPTDADREDYEKMQDEFFRQQGEVMSAQILKNAGLGDKTKLTTPEDAARLINFWGVSMSKIITEMDTIASSLATKVAGPTTSESLAVQQQTYIDALSSKGQKAYHKAIQLVRNEPFWDKYFGQHEIHVYPDLKSGNRFAGYNQVANDPDDSTGRRKVIIVHISSTFLENDFPEASASTIVHELSHTLYDPTVLKRALASLQGSVVDLLLEHPDIIKVRKKAADQAAAKVQQKARLSQIIYESIAYGETEIFALLQQYTHQPDMIIKKDGVEEPVRAAELVLSEVSRYVKRLQKIGLYPHMLKGVLDQLGRRVDLMYDDRIAAYPPKSKQRELMESNKKMAQLLFEMARNGEDF